MSSRPRKPGRRARATVVVDRCVLPEALEARRLMAFSLAVNFQPVGVSIPPGYTADTGAVYAERGNGQTFGWDVGNTSGARDRNSSSAPDQRYDTLTHTQAFGSRTWEIAVPDGQYEVKVVAGDPRYVDSVYQYDVEGVVVATGTPSVGSFFVEGTKTVTISDGRLTLSNGGGASNNKIAFIQINSVDGPPPALPSVPGTIQAEDFDDGGAGVSYSDTTSGNLGGLYRDTAVDIMAASEGGYAVGYIRPNEWLKYTVNVETTGSYNLELRVASMTGGLFQVAIDGQRTPDVLTLPSTGGWQTWKTISYPAVNLSAGVHTLTLHFGQANGNGDLGNVNWIRLAQGVNPTLPAVSVDATDATAAEPANNGAFTFSRTGSTATPLTINYTVSGTATNGVDYNTLAGSIIIPAGSLSATLAVTPKDDTAVEGSENVRVTISNSAAYQIGVSNDSVTIADNDSNTVPEGTWPASWTSAAQGNRNRWESGAAVVDGKIWVFGGWFSGSDLATQSYDVYDPATNKWTFKGTMPVAHSHFAMAADDASRTIYFAGGLFGSYPGIPSNKAWKLNTLTNTWTELPSMPENHSSGGMALVNNQLHYMGGTTDERDTNTGRHLVLNLGNLAAGWQAAPDLPAPRDHLGVIALGGKIYAIGGEFGHDLVHDQQKLVHRYDPIARTWQQLASLPTAKSHFEAAIFVTPAGKIVVAGGQVDDWQSTDEVVQYDPATDKWTVIGKLPTKNQGGVVQQIGNKIYVHSGNPGAGPNKLTWIGTLG